MRLKSTAWILAIVLTAGCGGDSDDSKGSGFRRRNVATNLGGLNLPSDDDNGAKPKSPAPPAPNPPAPTPPGTTPPPPPPPPAVDPSTPVQDPNVVQVEAAPGVSGKGNYRQGIITTPLSTYFFARERIKFIQVEQAMKIFRALNERYPKSHEEFMEKIIKENGITLPSLRGPDDQYKYDPQTAKLMVERRR